MKRLAYATMLLGTTLLAAGMGYYMPTFSEFDLNGDGHITKAELQKAREDRMIQKANEGKMLRNAGNAPAFEQMDKNGDGVIDANEFKTHQQERLNR